MNRFLPRANAALVDAQLRATTEFRRFLESLADRVDSDTLRQLIDSVIQRLDSIEARARGNVVGLSSVSTTGNLASGDVYVMLANDQDAPDAGSYYGAEKETGLKGWHPLVIDGLRDVEASAPLDGYGLVWSAAEQKWVPAPVTFAFGSPLTDDSGNFLTDPDGNVLTDGRLSIDWADIGNKPNTDQIPEGLVNLYVRRAALTDQTGRVITDQAGRPIFTNSPQIPLAWIPGVQAAVKDIYPLSALPPVTPYPREIYVSGTSGVTGIIPAYSDGTNWLRFSDNTPVN